MILEHALISTAESGIEKIAEQGIKHAAEHFAEKGFLRPEHSNQPELKNELKSTAAQLFTENFKRPEQKAEPGLFNPIKSDLQNFVRPEQSKEPKISDIVDIREKQDVQEIPEKLGGRFADVFKPGEGDKKEVHHMPADSISPLERLDGPAIKMDKEDHRLTASCGNSRDAIEYRQKQQELIKEGKFREAVQMDIDDIREKFGDKYDEAISEMLDYVDQLEQEGKI